MLIAIALSLTPVPSADPPSGPAVALTERIDRLIASLGDPDFAVREKAYVALEAIGGPAYAKLAAAAKSPDSEIRMRASQLANAVRQADFDRRVRLLFDDGGVTETHDLPGFAELIKAAGNDRNVRETYTSFLRDPGLRKVFLLAEQSPGSISAAVQGYAAALQARNRNAARLPPPGIVVRPAPAAPPPPPNQVALEGPYTLTEILGVLLLDSLAPLETREQRRIGFSAAQLLYQTPLRNAVVRMDGTKSTPNLDEKGRVARAILGMWFDSRVEPIELNLTVIYAGNYAMPESLERAVVKQLENKAATGPMRGSALAGLAKTRGAAAVPTLEKFLKDTNQAGIRYETVTDENGRAVARQTPIEMRDVALAAILHLSDRKPREYGMQVYSDTDAMKFQATNAWFKTDDDRKKAFERFEAERGGRKTAP
jgi:hypothetical protein